VAERGVIGVNGGALPRGYTLSASEQLLIETAVATFNGSGAASAFLAAIAFYAPSGELLGRTFASTQIAAGSSAEVTFAPF
jgi:hypothetical protein